VRPTGVRRAGNLGELEVHEERKKFRDLKVNGGWCGLGSLTSISPPYQSCMMGKDAEFHSWETTEGGDLVSKGGKQPQEDPAGVSIFRRKGCRQMASAFLRGTSIKVFHGNLP